MKCRVNPTLASQGVTFGRRMHHYGYISTHEMHLGLSLIAIFRKWRERPLEYQLFRTSRDDVS